MTMAPYRSRSAVCWPPPLPKIPRISKDITTRKRTKIFVKTFFESRCALSEHAKSKPRLPFRALLSVLNIWPHFSFFAHPFVGSFISKYYPYAYAGENFPSQVINNSLRNQGSNFHKNLCSGAIELENRQTSTVVYVNLVQGNRLSSSHFYSKLYLTKFEWPNSDAKK